MGANPVSTEIVLYKTICYGTFSHGNNQRTTRMSSTETNNSPDRRERRIRSQGRPPALDRPRGPVRRLFDDHPRPDDRERGPASIKHDLHFSQSGLAWVVNAYLIAFGGLLLLVGRLGDLLGRRRIFLLARRSSPIASLVCGVSDSQGLLVGARFVRASAEP